MMSMPLGEYDKAIESSESLTMYEGSRLFRYIKEMIAGFKYGTKSNPRTKGNVISYIDSMGRLITQELGKKDDTVEYAVRKISTSAKTEAIISIEVVEKKKNENGETIEQIRMFYPNEEEYKSSIEYPRIKEITYFKDNKSYLRKTIERALSPDEMEKRFDAGTIKLNCFAPDTIKNEIIGSKMIYTVDRLKTDENIDEKLKPFGTHIQINETEKTYIVLPNFNPEKVDEIKDYVGPTECEKDVVLYKASEPKARIEETEKITFSYGKIHNISSSIMNYPDKDGNYGGEGRGTCAIYDDKILHATGNKSVRVYKKDNEWIYKIDGTGLKADEGYEEIATAEIRGSLINLCIQKQDGVVAEDIGREIIKTFKTNWSITSKTVVEYKTDGDDKMQKLDIKEIFKPQKVVKVEAKENVTDNIKTN